MKKLFFPKGFTLIELLIVITIIGILAVALLPSVLGAPARARDAARKADIQTAVQAIEAFAADNKKYPTGDGCIEQTAEWAATLKKYFRGELAPKDPQGTGGYSKCKTGYYYCQLSGSPYNYALVTNMEIKGDANTTSAALPNSCDATAVLKAFTDPHDNDHIYVIGQ